MFLPFALIMRFPSFPLIISVVGLIIPVKDIPTFSRSVYTYLLGAFELPVRRHLSQT